MLFTLPLLLLSFYPLQAQFSITGLADKVIETFSGTILRDSSAYPASWVIAPLLAYSPETSVQIGMGGILLYKSRRALPEDRSSFLYLSARYTLNQQVTLSPSYFIFSPGEKYIHSGSLRYRKFPQFYYGIGNDTPASNEELYDISTLELEHLSYRNIVGKLYAGAGLRFLRSYNLELPEGGLLATYRPVGTTANTAAGPGFGLLFDNRNNLMSTSQGVLAEFRHTIHHKNFGSDNDYTLSLLDVRAYWAPFGKRKDILAGQVYAYLSEGDIPFNELAPLGGDMIMRGYYLGRYLDEKLLATQVEYRFHVWKSLSMVTFAGIGDVAPRLSAFEWDELKYSVGGGFRYELLPGENLNIRFDYAIGRDTQNFYINLSEAF
ncbi:MAG: BamA/TamA family outer membrane protein [Cyclobacteriaceae bacterium]